MGYKNPDTQPYIPTGAIEEILVKAFANYLTVAEKDLKIGLPIIVELGLFGVKNFNLAVSQELYGQPYLGPIFDNFISLKFRIRSFDADPYDALRPFFEKLYDCAGELRLDIRPRSLA
jgi:hypothetical protein